MSIVIKTGAIKFKSITAAYESAKKKQPNLKYITFYARVKAKENKLGLGWSASQAYAKPVRSYKKAA